VEKPVCAAVDEGRKMVDAARKYNPRHPDARIPGNPGSWR
jgi:hypothetical protein